MMDVKRRIQAMNDVFGLQQEDVREGLSPADIGMLLGRSVDSVTGAPTRAGVGAMITGEDPLAAASQQFGANPDTAPEFGPIEDMVLDPSNLVAFGGKNIAARLAALGEVGAVGKFQAADKIGNVLHAKNEFHPLLREQAQLAKLNRAALKGKPKAGQPTLAFEKMRMDIPGPESLDGMSKLELEEMLKRVEIDQNAHRGEGQEFYKSLWDDQNNAGNALIELRDKAKKQLGQMEELTALTKKPTVRRLFDPEIDRELERRLYWAADDDKQVIQRLLEENRALPGFTRGKKYTP